VPCVDGAPSGYHQGRETDDISVGNDNDFTNPAEFSLVGQTLFADQDLPAALLWGTLAGREY